MWHVACCFEIVAVVVDVAVAVVVLVLVELYKLQILLYKISINIVQATPTFNWQHSLSLSSVLGISLSECVCVGRVYVGSIVVVVVCLFG